MRQMKELCGREVLKQILHLILESNTCIASCHCVQFTSLQLLQVLDIHKAQDIKKCQTN